MDMCVCVGGGQSYPVMYSVKQSGNHREHRWLQRAQVIGEGADVTLEEADLGTMHQHHPLA